MKKVQIVNSKLGQLPEWDLTDLYSDPSSKLIEDDLNFIKLKAMSFEKKYKGAMSNLSAEGLLSCFKEKEQIDKKIGRLSSYAGLRYYQDSSDKKRVKFLSDIQEKIINSTTLMVFFSLELGNFTPEHIMKLIDKNEKLFKYSTLLRRMRSMAPFRLSSELELFVNDQSVVGATAWNRLFDETISRISFFLNGTSVSIETALSYLQDPDETKRAKAAQEISKMLDENLPIFGRVTNTLIKEKEIQDRWRKYPNPQHERHLENDIEPEVIEALTTAVKESYPQISHRYYKLKAKWLKKDKLQLWDRNAPFPNENPQETSWKEAQEIVLDSYEDFSPKIGTIAKKFFRQNWIDAAIKPGKSPGAFAHPTVTDVHPYILLNYTGKNRDIMTLSHELGHGVHQFLAAKQGELMASTPLTLAETASVFGEMLTFKKLLKRAKSKKERNHLLAGKIEDMINTVIRQISFYDFECQIHDARKKGELTTEQISDIWMSTTKESLGDSFVYNNEYRNFWAYIPHFIHSPFYVYAYAFGDGLVNALFAIYESGESDFETKYIEMLSSGGSKHHSELLKPFGLVASDPEFWKNGLGVISNLIDQLEDINS